MASEKLYRNALKDRFTRFMRKKLIGTKHSTAKRLQANLNPCEIGIICLAVCLSLFFHWHLWLSRRQLVVWRGALNLVRRINSRLGGGGVGTPLQETNGDVPLDGVAFS